MRTNASTLVRRGTIAVVVGLLGASFSSDDGSTAPSTPRSSGVEVDRTASATEPTDTASSDRMDTAVVDTAAAGTDPPPTVSPTTESPPTVSPTTEPPPAGPATTLPAAQDVPSSPSAGCATVVSTPGESTDTFTGAGMRGTFILHLLLDVMTPEPLPLVVDLHGYSEPAALHAVQGGLPSFGTLQDS